jgi:hypothetical protein
VINFGAIDASSTAVGDLVNIQEVGGLIRGESAVIPQ